ncbi:DUF6264 family protein [Microbacterium sp. H1-D42]|uniref:DUF6264 family protein n=1 Tax=Microbacterium sp. H1-D42 TaxID=2925844 RepID=UPI001F536DE4|nr:DUF6264 family protein [Microbacterium sp. H1-D42]UNK69870.1 DUF6264 family protein [Microbacterium sp. H1-D42]
MSMDRPQYGEYATPEEQRAAAGLPPLEPNAAAGAPAGGHPTPHSQFAPMPPQAPAHHAVAPLGTAGSQAVSDAPARAAGPMNRLVTIVLLALGLVNVVSSIPGFLDLSTTLSTSLEMLGVEGEFSNFAAARVWGTIAVIVMVVGYAATAWLSFRRLKRGRAAWWLPLVGFVVTMLLVSVCVSVPMMGDPAFIQSLPTAPAG